MWAHEIIIQKLKSLLSTVPCVASPFGHFVPEHRAHMHIIHLVRVYYIVWLAGLIIMAGLDVVIWWDILNISYCCSVVVLHTCAVNLNKGHPIV